MTGSLREGFRAVRRNWGLVVLLLLPNLLLARLMAGSLLEALQCDLRNKGAVKPKHAMHLDGRADAAREDQSSLVRGT